MCGLCFLSENVWSLGLRIVKMIQSLLESVFEKVSKQNVKNYYLLSKQYKYIYIYIYSVLKMLNNAKSSCLTTHLLPKFTIYNDWKLMMNITIIGLLPLCFLLEYESWSCSTFLVIISRALNISNYNTTTVTSCHLPHNKVWTCYCSVLKVLTIVRLEPQTTTNNGIFFFKITQILKQFC